MKVRTKTLAILSVVGAVSMISSADGQGGPPLLCGVCEDYVDTSCDFIPHGWHEHVFTGTGSSGYEGHHSNQVCGACEDSHIGCGGGFAMKALQKAYESGGGAIKEVADRYPSFVQLDVTS